MAAITYVCAQFPFPIELTTRLERMALSKAPAPTKPRVNRSFNASHHPEILGEATNQRSRRS